MSAFSPCFLVTVSALVAINGQCWLKTAVLTSVIINLTFFSHAMLPYTSSPLHFNIFYSYALSLNFSVAWNLSCPLFFC